MTVPSSTPTLPSPPRTLAPSAHPAVASQALLSIRDLAVSFESRTGPRVQAVDGLSLTVYPRQTVAVVGESGCGKSVSAMSLLQLLPRPPARFDRGQALLRSKLAPPDATIDLLALSNIQIRKVRGDEVAMIFQEPMTSLNPVYSVGDQIIEAIRLHRTASRIDARDIAINAMLDVGIAEPQVRMEQYPHQFSGGMRQRVMIAMALACRPKLLIADEPTTALDVTIQAQILDLLRAIKDSRGMGVMLITHDLGIVAQNADVVCVMYAGRVVEYAPVFDLFENPLHPYTRGLLNSIPRLGTRRERLVTIKEVIETPSEFQRLPGAAQGVRPWWPTHTPPPDLQRTDAPAGEYTLNQVEPNHWVGLWRTAAVAHEQPKPPDLNFRRTAPE